MRRILVVLILLSAGCQPGFRSVEMPAEPDPDWIWSGASIAQEEPLRLGDLAIFGENGGAVASIRAAASPDDFYGSKLYDGFDFTFQPLDETDRPVKKLGTLSVTLYTFKAGSLVAKGTELMSWHVPPSKLAGLWQQGMLERGYQMKLAFTKRPLVEYTCIDVQFETLKGRIFTCTLTAVSLDQPRYRWLKK